MGLRTSFPTLFGMERRNWLGHIAFAVNFTVAKASIYVAPLAIAALAPAETYGAVELALAAGLLIAGMTIGTPFGGITQRFLVHKDSQVVDLAWTALSVSLGFCCILIGAAWLTGMPIIIFTASMLALSMIQSAGSTWFRTRGMRNRAAWADGFTVLSAGIGLAGASILWDQPGLMQFAALFASLTFISFIFSVMMALQTAGSQLYDRIVQATKIGWPMMLIGAMSIWLGVGGRIVFGIINAADLAIYSVAFRIAGLVLGVHQLVITAAFAQLYTARTRQSDKIMGGFIALIGAISTVTAVTAPYFVQYLDIAAVGPNEVPEFRGILAFACAHTLFWIAHALLQLRLNRLGFSANAVFPTSIALLAGTALILAFGIFVSANAVIVTALIALQACAYFAVSCFIFYGKKLAHPLIMLAAFSFGALLFTIGTFSLFAE